MQALFEQFVKERRFLNNSTEGSAAGGRGRVLAQARRYGYVSRDGDAPAGTGYVMAKHNT
jgi:hypothetical protein